jgi:diacylglycerol kinase (ATP)
MSAPPTGRLPADRPAAWTALLNPAAGRGRARTRLPRVADALGAIDAIDADVEIVVTADAADLATRAADAFARGRGVVACGGDGTVCTLAGLAAETHGVLAIVPSGSGNDFARHLGIPTTSRRGRAAAAGRAPARRSRWTSRTSPPPTAPAWFTTVANTGFDARPTAGRTR